MADSWVPVDVVGPGTAPIQTLITGEFSADASTFTIDAQFLPPSALAIFIVIDGLALQPNVDYSYNPATGVVTLAEPAASDGYYIAVAYAVPTNTDLSQYVLTSDLPDILSSLSGWLQAAGVSNVSADQLAILTKLAIDANSNGRITPAMLKNDDTTRQQFLNLIAISSGGAGLLTDAMLPDADNARLTWLHHLTRNTAGEGQGTAADLSSNDADLAQIADKTFTIVVQSSLAALKARGSTVNKLRYLDLGLRSGFFSVKEGDYSAHVVADTFEGQYLKMDGVDENAAILERQCDGHWRADHHGIARNLDALTTGCGDVLSSIINLGNLVKPASVTFSGGRYLVESQPPKITWQGSWRGERSDSDVGFGALISKRYVEADAVRGVFAFENVGFEWRNLQFVKLQDTDFPGTVVGANGSGGSMVSGILTSGNVNAGDIYIWGGIWSAGDFFNHTIALDGSLNTSVGGGGIRQIRIIGGQYFGCAAESWWFKSVKHLFASLFALGTDGGSSIYPMLLDGVSGNLSDDIRMNGLIAGPAQIKYTSRAEIESLVVGFPTIASTCQDVRWDGAGVGGIGSSKVQIEAGATRCAWTGSTQHQTQQLGLGGEIPGTGVALQAKGLIQAYVQYNAVTKVNAIGGTASSFVLPDGQSVTITCPNGKLLDIAYSTVEALCHAAYGSATINILSDPMNAVVNSATPPSGKIGVSKAASSHDITINNNSGASITVGIAVYGRVTNATDPA